MRPGPSSILYVLLLAGCQAGTGTNTRVAPPAPLASPAAAYAGARGGTPLLPGQVSGYVARFDGRAFVAAPGVEVTLAGAGVRATTDALGFYGFANVPAGVLKLEAAPAGDHAAALACRLSSMHGLARANLALVPQARPAGLAADALAFAGVAVDPRGTALPGATVRIADSLSTVGNRAVTADPDGFWAAIVPGVAADPLASGTATLTAFGTTPGGVKVESTAALTLEVGRQPTLAVTATTSAFAAPSALAWEAGAARRRVLTGENLPTRRDELVLRFTTANGFTEATPAEASPGRVAIDLPPGTGPGVTVELLPLGLLPPDGKPVGIAAP